MKNKVEHTVLKSYQSSLLPKKKIRCYRRKNLETGITSVVDYCPPPSFPEGISALPDSIQALILNSLPIKESFKTRLVSESWRDLCSSLPSLEFHPSEFKSNKCYKMEEVINQILRHYSLPAIDQLSIVLDAPVPDSQIDNWFSFAVSHNVQTFLFWDAPLTSNVRPSLYTCPSTIFTCASLVCIQLKNIRVVFPTATDKFVLPKLTCLELLKCGFTNAVFSKRNYPMLLRLHLKACQYDFLSISSSSLEHLCISKSVGNPEIEVLSAPRFSIFYYIENHHLSLSCEILSSLRVAYFFITSAHHFRSWNLASNMLQGGFTSARDLSLGAYFVDFLRVNWGRHKAPCFSSVRSLNLQYSGKRDVPVLKLLLRNFPNLVSFATACNKTEENDDNTTRFWEEKDKEKLPANFLNSLVTYTAKFKGGDEESEFELIKFVVQNVTALRNINIYVLANVEINESVCQKLKTIASQKTEPPLNVEIARLSY